LITTVLAAALIFGGAEYLIGQFSGPSGNPLADALGELPSSHGAVLLMQDREHVIAMDAATKKFKVIETPTVASVPAPPGGAPTVYVPPPDPGTAQAIAYNMLKSFGFSHSQFGCLDNIWSRESGWRYNAYNASGAYGIPQALPGSKMAAAGPNWQTDPTTQIRWGLGYIKGRYGTPCDAWAFWQDNGWY
jgi:hypothetical protein